MTPYMLDWNDDAYQMLAAVCLVAFDQAAITRAEYAAETLLEFHPLRDAVELSEGLWKLTVGPPIVYFSVDEAAHVVHVSGFGYAP